MIRDCRKVKQRPSSSLFSARERAAVYCVSSCGQSADLAISPSAHPLFLPPIIHCWLRFTIIDHMATLIPLNADMVAWVRGVLDELRSDVGEQQFNAWLVAGNRDKVMEIARMLQSRGDPRSATAQHAKDLTKTIKAFLTSVFYLKLSLANLRASSPVSLPWSHSPAS